MRYLLFLLLLIPFPAIALTGDAARTGAGNGGVTIADDTTSTCNNAATIRYSAGEGRIVQTFDTTATCTAASTPKIPDLIYFD